MRHTDPRTTSKIYTDEKMLPLAAELAKVPSLPDVSAPAPEAIPLRATGTDDATRAPLMHQTSGLLGQRLAPEGTGINEGGVREGASGTVLQVASMSAIGIKKENPASSDTGRLRKRVKGVEPSTFTLAT